MSRELVFTIVKIQSIFWIFHIMIVLTASRDSWCPIFFLSRLAQKLVYAFKTIPFSNFAFSQNGSGASLFGLWTADSARRSPPPIHPSPVPPQLCQEPQNGWNRAKSEDKSQTEELLRTLRKCFIIFKKDCQGFSQGTHDPCFISSLFSIIFRFFFSAWNYIEIVSETTCLYSCVCPCLNRQARVLLPVFLFWSHSGATEGRWRVF